MAKKPNFLKNLLTTASAVAVLAGGVQSTLAVDFVTTGNVDVNAKANFNSAGGAAAGAPDAGAGNTIYVDADGRVISNLGAGANIPIIDAYGHTATLNAFGGNVAGLQLRNAASLNAAGVNAAVAAVTAANGGPVAIGANNGAVYTIAPGANDLEVTAGAQFIAAYDFANNGNTFKISQSGADAANPLNISSTFTSTGGNNGNIVVNGNFVQFNGAFDATGGQQVGNLTINDGKSAIMNTDLNLSADVTLGSAAAGGASLTIKAGKNINVVDISGDAHGKGTLTFLGNSIVTGTIGTNKQLNTVAINAGVVQTPDGELKSNTITIATGATLKNTTADLVVEAGTINGAGTIQFGDGNNIAITGTTGGVAAALNIGAAGAGNAFGNVDFNGKNNTLALAGGGNNSAVYLTNVTTGAANTGKITLDDSNWTVSGNFGSDKSLNLFQLDGANAKTVTLVSGTNINAQLVNLGRNGANGKLILNDKVTINSTDTKATAAGGSIEVVAGADADNRVTASITGAIGNTNILNSIKIGAFATLEVTPVANGQYDINAGNANGNINFGNGSVLKLMANASGTITSPITVVATGNGTIDAFALAGTKTLTLKGNIGANANNLGLIDLTGGAKVVLNGGDVFVDKIDMSGNDGVITLDSAKTYFIKELVHGDGQVTLNVNEDLTIKAGTELSANATNPLKALTFINAANKTLTLEEGVNLYTNGITTITANAGTLLFKGDNTVSGNIGTNVAKLAAITLNAGGNIKTVTLNGDVNLNGNITFAADNMTLVLGGNVTVGDIAPGANANSSLVFSNLNAATVNGTVGNGNTLKSITINSADVTFTGVTKVTSVVFNNANKAASVTYNNKTGLELANLAVTTAGKNIHNIVLATGADVTLDANASIGTEANHLGNFIWGSDNTLTIRNAKFFAGVTNGTKGNGAGKIAVAAGANGVEIDRIGADGAALSQADFGDNATVRGDTYANDITIADTKTVNFNGTVAGTALTFNGADAAATFTNVTLSTVLTPGGVNNGTATFNGTGSILANIGINANALKNLTFAAGSNYQFGSQDVAAIVIENAPTTFAAGSTLNVQGKTVTFNTSDTTFAGNNIITLNTGNLIFDNNSDFITKQLPLTINTTLAGDNLGFITLGKDADVKNVNVSINVDANAVDLEAATGQELTLIDLQGTKLNNFDQNRWQAQLSNAAQINSGGIYSVDGVIYTEAENVNLVIGEHAQEVFQAIVSSELKDAAAKFGNPKNTLDGKTLRNDLAALVIEDAQNGTSTAPDAIARISESTAGSSSQTTIQTTEQTVSMVQNLIQSIGAQAIQVVENRAGAIVAENSGIAAGDESTRYGIWGSPFYSQTSQKKNKSGSGYKTKSYGGTIGFDTKANDELTIGAAVSILNTKVKHKDVKAGDKTTANVAMFSLYGIQQLPKDFFIEAIASFGSSKVTNSEKIVKSTATAKYDSLTYGAEAIGGYNYKGIESVVITPMLGFGYTKFVDGGYTETGAAYPRTITKRSSDRPEVIAGTRIATSMDVNGINVTPEAHAFVRHAFNNKSLKIESKINGLAEQLAPISVKPIQTYYNLGLGFTAKDGNMEYSAGYDATIAKKYVGHQGTLKVRVNF